MVLMMVDLRAMANIDGLGGLVGTFVLGFTRIESFKADHKGSAFFCLEDDGFFETDIEDDLSALAFEGDVDGCWKMHVDNFELLQEFLLSLISRHGEELEAYFGKLVDKAWGGEVRVQLVMVFFHVKQEGGQGDIRAFDFEVVQVFKPSLVVRSFNLLEIGVFVEQDFLFCLFYPQQVLRLT